MSAPSFGSAAAMVAAHGARGLARSKLVLGAALVGLFAAMLALALRFAADEWGADAFEPFAVAALSSVVAPLVALLLGTWAVGAEREAGTLVFAFARPIRRSAILAGRAATAIAASIATVVVVAVACGLVLSAGGVSIGNAAVALALETLALTAVFVMLGTLLPRALYVGLAYAVLVEGVLGGVVSLSSGATITQHARNLLARWATTDELTGVELVEGVGASVAFLLVATGLTLAVAAAWIETREVPTRERVRGE